MKKITIVNILGTNISILNYSSVLSIINKQVQNGSNFICIAAVSSIMEFFHNKKLQKSVNNSLITTPDGMPLVWLSKLKLKRKVERIYGPNLMLKVCKLAQKRKYKLFFIGGSKNQSNHLKKKLIYRFPKLVIVGMEETPIRPIPKKQNIKIIKNIKKTKPDIIFVGLGCPSQEQWIIENYNKFNKGIFIGVGAAFDFISGKVKQAPAWVQNIGFEWLYRFMQDPKRLWKRYLLYNSQFIYQVIKNYKNIYEEETTLP